MRIIIAGDGKVGLALTRLLSQEGHDLVTIDSNRAVLERDMQRGVHFSCCKTAQQVDFIGACGGDEHFCLLYLRFVQRGHGGAVAHHGHDVELLHIPFQNRPIGIDGHKVVTLL